MATTDHIIATPLGRRRDGLDQPQPNLLLRAGSWQATCRGGGAVLVAGWRRDRVEGTAARISCPVLVEVAA
jgi:hypothetical protein